MTHVCYSLVLDPTLTDQGLPDTSPPAEGGGRPDPSPVQAIATRESVKQCQTGRRIGSTRFDSTASKAPPLGLSGRQPTNEAPPDVRHGYALEPAGRA